MSLHDRPNASELLEAVRQFLIAEVAETTSDRRLRFRALIAANVLAIVERERAAAPADAASEDTELAALGFTDGPAGERRRALCARIRAGDFDSAEASARAFAYARATTMRKLAAANPRFLERLISEEQGAQEF